MVVCNDKFRKIKTKPIFLWLKKMGLEDKEMLKTFNCGIGFCVIAKEKTFQKFINTQKIILSLI